MTVVLHGTNFLLLARARLDHFLKDPRCDRCESSAPECGFAASRGCAQYGFNILFFSSPTIEPLDHIVICAQRDEKIIHVVLVARQAAIPKGGGHRGAHGNVVRINHAFASARAFFAGS